MSTERTWTPEQLAAIGERRAELVVSAAAGSGKTAVLIERVHRAALGLIADGNGGLKSDPAQRTGLERMLVVTFTNAAAAELRARLTAALNAEYARPHSERRVPVAVVREQLAALPRAQISTFHGFCGEIVRRWGHLNGVGYDRVLAAEEGELLRHELATRFLDERLGAGAAAQDRRLALAWGGPDGVGPEDLSRVRYARGLRRELLTLLDFQRAQPDPDEWFRRAVNFGAAEFPQLDPHACDPSHPLLVALGVELARWVEDTIARLEELAARLRADRPSAKYCELARRLVPRLGGLSLDHGWEAAAEYIEQRLKEKQDDIKYKPALLQAYRRDLDKDDPWYERLAAEHKPLADGVANWLELFSRPWAEVAQAENETRQLLGALWRLARGFDQRYRDYKRERNVVDFDDMQLLALDLLSARVEQGGFAYSSDGRLLPSDVALELRRRFELVLVDEHQDTNEVQEAIIDLVTRDAPAGGGGGGRPLFRVGDLKQSIYTFRLAVPQLFSDARERIAARDDGSGRVVKLQANFRSQPQLLTAINHLFDGLMTPQLGGEDYADNRLIAGRPYGADDRQPAELHLVVTDAGGDDEDAGDGAEAGDEDDLGTIERIYAHVAQVLAGLHGDVARPVYDRDGNARPADWRDMVVLMRSTAGRIEMLLSTCARARVPVYAPGRSGFYERPEVADALALLNVVDNPRQDIPLAAVLSGPAVGLDYAGLLKVACAPDCDRAGGEPADLWERMLWYCGAGDDEGLAARLVHFHRQLAGWRAALRLDSLPELLWRIYADTGLLAASAALPNGEQRVANLYRLHDLARRSADSERQSLARFLRGLELSRRSAGDLGEAPLLTEAQNVVRVMTVHQAKGLEFPVVVVPDLDKRINFQDLGPDVLWHRTAGAGGRWVDWPQPGAAIDAGADEPPARKLDTLGHLLCREARRRDIVSEELRILYVALTRARDRLVLIGGIDAEKLSQLPAAHRGGRARCWLDWIAPQLHAGAMQASESNMPAVCGVDDCWQVSAYRETAAPKLKLALPEPTSLDEQLRAELMVRLERLAARPAPLRLPAKLTVTRLAHRLAEPPDGDEAFKLEPAASRIAPAAVPLPRFLSAGRDADAVPEPRQIGTAAHILLAELDLSRPYEVDEISGVRDALIEQGRLDTPAAQAVGIAAMAHAAAELRERLALDGVRLYAELPVALLVPADDPVLARQLVLAGLGSPAGDEASAGDAVYVQGVIDLLAVGDGVATVIDYKTDRNAGAADLVARYGGQLDWYCRSVAQLLPEHAVRWAIYGLSGAGLAGPFDWLGDT